MAPGPSQTLTQEKVFCRECTHLSLDSIHKETAKCMHPDNRDVKLDTWLRPGVGLKRRPQKINKKNNCPWFKEKPSGGKKLL